MHLLALRSCPTPCFPTQAQLRAPRWNRDISFLPWHSPETERVPDLPKAGMWYGLISIHQAAFL